MELKLTGKQVETIILALYYRIEKSKTFSNGKPDKRMRSKAIRDDAQRVLDDIEEQETKFVKYQKRYGEIETLSHYRGLDDHALVIACLHASGDLEDRLGEVIQWEVYCNGDGFGVGLLSDELSEINEGWDWSHIRDSSPQSFKAMADILRPLLAAIVEGPVSCGGRRTL